MGGKSYFVVEYLIHGVPRRCTHRHPTHRAAMRCKLSKEERFAHGCAAKSPVTFNVLKVK